jgi:hypothetical protein
MHLLIILLQQLLGMLPSSKQVPQPEVVRKGSASPNSGEPDACGRIAPSLCGWMTPFKQLHSVAGPISLVWTRFRTAGELFILVPEALWNIGIAQMRAGRPLRRRRPRS